mmetsp:Transcript_49890/g.131302  ORF Transcript_49890/g.131302 Transcript_49890/m.131302 type:complete len:156 (-) Transcript_49890:479-946(-)
MHNPFPADTIYPGESVYRTFRRRSSVLQNPDTTPMRRDTAHTTNTDQTHITRASSPSSSVRRFSTAAQKDDTESEIIHPKMRGMRSWDNSIGPGHLGHFHREPSPTRQISPGSAVCFDYPRNREIEPPRSASAASFFIMLSPGAGPGQTCHQTPL